MHGLKLVIKEEALPLKEQPEFPALAELAKRGLLPPDAWSCNTVLQMRPLGCLNAVYRCFAPSLSEQNGRWIPRSKLSQHACKVVSSQMGAALSDKAPSICSGHSLLAYVSCSTQSIAIGESMT